MLLNTKHFGEIEIDESGIIVFSNGIPGFEQSKRYTVLYNNEDKSPFKWLQSIDSPELAFVIVDPFALKSDYDINLRDEVVNALEIEQTEDVVVYSIVVIPDEVMKISMNLKAPIIINLKKGKGMQVILDTEQYSVRHYIVDELRRQEEMKDACTDKKEGSVNCNK